MPTTNRAARMRRYSESAFLMRATPYGAAHIVPTGEADAWIPRALCGAEINAPTTRDGPYTASGVLEEDCCGHCRKRLEVAT